MLKFNDYISALGLKRGLFILAACLFLTGLSAAARAQTAPRDWTVLALEVIEQRQKIADLRQREQQVIDEIDRVGFSLDVHKRELDRIKAEADNIEKDLLLLTQKIAILENRAIASHAASKDSFVKLYELRMLGDIGSLASADSLISLSLRQKLIGDLLKKEYATSQALLASLAELGAARAEMLDMQAYKNKKMAEAQAKLQEVNAIRAQNEKLLTNIAKEKDLQLAALLYMEASSRQLDDQLLKLNAIALDAAAEKKPLTGLFSAAKGLLIMPVKGTITTKFGPYTPAGENTELFRKGIDIKATPNAKVNAVFAGTIVYADWFKGYGNMLIIDHSEGYFTIYARLGKMYKSLNSVVLGGEIIGETNSDPGLAGTELYFEIRHHAQPLNPAVWLAKNR